MKTNKKKIEAIMISAIMIVFVFATLIPTASAAVTCNDVGETVTAGLDSQVATTADLVITSGAADDIAIDTNINITIPKSSGITFDENAVLTVTPAGDITVGIHTYESDELNTIIVIPVTATSAAGNTVTVAGIKVNVTSDAADGAITMTVVTTNVVEETSEEKT